MTGKPAYRVLVLDADMVPALTITRSLARRGCVISSASNVEKPVGGYSRHVKFRYRYPDPLSEEEAFLAWLARHTKENEYDLVIPVTERSLVPISNNRPMFAHVKIAMPSARSLELALDKEQTVALAKRVDVPVPAGIAVSSLEELADQLHHINYPVVLKPVRSLGSTEVGSSQLRVSYAFDEIGLFSGCEHALKFGPILLQEYFRGQGVGVELIAKNGEIVYAFQHLRLHEVPLTGGGSTLRKSESLAPELLAASERLIRALEWNGVAMVEFKWDPETRQYSLMEINGRFWGSLPLADAAGADFPAMLLDLEIENEIQPCKPYKPDIYCRKLASDLYWYEAVIRRGPESRIADIPSGKQIVKELGLFLSLRHRYDVQSLRDPVPGLVDLFGIVSSYCHRSVVMLKEKHFLWRQKRAWRRGDVAKSIAAADNVLFLCYGNINRSALSDVLIRSYAEDSGLSVVSAGFHQESGRPADPVMIEVASENGTNLAASRSTILTPDMVSASDVIFAMEKSHVDSLLEMDKASSDKVFLLGAHGGRSGFGPEIQDPYGRSRDEYQFCYRRIAEAVDHLKSILAYRRVQ